MPKKYSSITRREFVKFLEYIGCKLDRTKGDHSIYTKEGLSRALPITKDREVPRLHIQTILKTLNMSYEEFETILKKAN